MSATNFSITKFLATEQETISLAAHLAGICNAGDVILLYGEVGAGKTTFARGFIHALTSETQEITSPTFTLVQSYDVDSRMRGNDNLKIYHCDLYRLKYAQELAELGLEEAFETAISLIEWPEIIENEVQGALKITLEIEGSGRSAKIEGNEEWQKRLKNL